jgi:hypothetical protein
MTAVSPTTGQSAFYSATRTQALLRVACLSVLFHLLYATYLSTLWGYLGFGLLPTSTWAVARTYALVLVPALLVPLRSGRRTILVFFVLYNLLYLPSEFSLLFTSGSWERGTSIQIVLAIGFGLLALSFRLPVRSIRMPPTTWWLFAGALVALCILCVAIALSGGLGNLKFANFFDASSQRRAQEEATGILGLYGSGYIFAWVTYVVAPLLILIGLIRKRLLLFALGCMTEVLIYAAATAKFALLTPPFVILAWLFCRRDNGRVAVKYTYWSSGLLFSSTLVANTLLGVPNAVEHVLSFFVMRYFGYQGVSTVLYARFAEARGYTYWSHVKGVSAYIPYPFDQALPWEISDFSWGFPGTSAPGHPWAQDGLVAAGLGGVLVISCVVAAVFWITDAFTARARASVVVPIMLIQGILLAESSLFTQLLSNGWLVFCLLLWVSPNVLRDVITKRFPAPAADMQGATAP